MFKLIKNVDIYNPNYIGRKDILICNDKIIKIEENINFNEAKIIDKEGFIAIPGIIDQHVHITGGGGEGGFHTRTPEVTLSNLISSGITTVVGLLGTDSLTRSVENLLAKTKALRNEGLSAYCLTGAYSYPSPTITGSVSKDIAFIDEIIGVKLAISDHREPMITESELAKLSSEVRVSSLISNKVGIITLHMGDDNNRLNKIINVFENSSIPIFHFRPTHVNRNKELFNDSLTFLQKGGYIDITVGNNFKELKENIDTVKMHNLSFERITFSSDGNGSWSKYDENGKLIRIGVSSCDGIIKSMKYLIENNYSIEEVIKFGTKNVACGLKLDNKKGQIKENYDADILLLDSDFNLDTVISLGNIMMDCKKILVKGTFED